jgi:crossover junction endodeoxyribonuclease RusA
VTAPALTVWVPGTPAPQGSMKGYVRGKRAVLVSDNKRTMPWRETIRAVLRANGHGCELLDCPVFVSMSLYFKRPPSHYTKKGLKPRAPFAPVSTRHGDLDKLMRAVGDALTGVVVRDDSRIIDARIAKLYCDPGGHVEPGLALSIEPMDNSGRPLAWHAAPRRDASGAPVPPHARGESAAGAESL